MTDFLEKALRIQEQLDDERRENENERNRGITEMNAILDKTIKINRLNAKNSTKTLMVRCITNYALDGSFHPNLRNIEFMIMNKDGSIQYTYILSHLYFDEIVLRDWENTSRYGNVSWYKEKEVLK